MLMLNGSACSLFGASLKQTILAILCLKCKYSNSPNISYRIIHSNYSFRNDSFSNNAVLMHNGSPSALFELFSHSKKDNMGHIVCKCKYSLILDIESLI